MKSKILTLLTALVLVQICVASALTINSATSAPSEVQPGEQLALKLEIENDLNQDIENVIVRLVLDSATNPAPFAPYQSSNEYSIEEISEDDEENANFDLVTLSDAESGTYTIPVEVMYTLANGTIVPSQSLGLVSLTVNAKPKIEISSENAALIKGAKEKVTIKIVNSGMGESKFLSIKLKQTNGINVLGLDNVYIGSIDSNDFDSADFEVFVNANAISPINLPLEITYTDSMNNPITEDKLLPLVVYTSEEAIKMGLIKKNNTLPIVISVVLIIAAYFVYRRVRKKNKNKKSNSE